MTASRMGTKLWTVGPDADGAVGKAKAHVSDVDFESPALFNGVALLVQAKFVRDSGGSQTLHTRPGHVRLSAEIANRLSSSGLLPSLSSSRSGGGRRCGRWNVPSVLLSDSLRFVVEDPPSVRRVDHARVDVAIVGPLRLSGDRSGACSHVIVRLAVTRTAFQSNFDSHDPLPCR